MPYDLVILISDLHIPFHHPDAIRFLAAIKKKYWAKANNPIAVNLGDELTWSSISYHEKSPALPAPRTRTIYVPISHQRPLQPIP